MLVPEKWKFCASSFQYLCMVNGSLRIVCFFLKKIIISYIFLEDSDSSPKDKKKIFIFHLQAFSSLRTLLKMSSHRYVRSQEKIKM